MAKADYWLCDVCGEKSFYDANLNWDYDNLTRHDGKMLPPGAGDMAAICLECAITHVVVVKQR